MGKRRHSAKTGDKKLYARRSEHSSSSAGKPVQDSIEDFLKEKDESYLALNSKESDGESAAENFTTKHDILDLGVRGESSEDEEDETDIEDIPNGGSSKFTSRYSVVPFETGTDDDDESDMGPDTEELDQVDPRSWGRKKSSYYDADTGDLEIGQDEEVCSFEWIYVVHMSLYFLRLVCRMHLWKKKQRGKYRHPVSGKWTKMISLSRTATARARNLRPCQKQPIIQQRGT